MLGDVRKGDLRIMYTCICPPATRATRTREVGGHVGRRSGPWEASSSDLSLTGSYIRGRPGLGIGSMNIMTVPAGKVEKPQ
jgi:hypothetical protein